MPQSARDTLSTTALGGDTQLSDYLFYIRAEEDYGDMRQSLKKYNHLGGGKREGKGSL